MKRMLALLSLSLWAAALVFAPAPANAFEAAYASYSNNYFACAVYKTINPIRCYDGDGTLLDSFTAKMDNTIPLSSCAGSCNGTLDLLVKSSPGNGRKQNMGMSGQCGSLYILELATCTSCS